VFQVQSLLCELMGAVIFTFGDPLGDDQLALIL
jgi:hypothetical protein